MSFHSIATYEHRQNKWINVSGELSHKRHFPLFSLTFCTVILQSKYFLDDSVLEPCKVFIIYNFKTNSKHHSPKLFLNFTI